MAIPLMEDDVEVISKLGVKPGSENGLTVQQLKERFDLSSVRIKNFINGTLIPNLNQLVDVQALLNGILDTSLSLADKAASAKAVGEKIAEVLQVANAALPKSGGIMTGGINMSNQQITGIPAPVGSNNAVNKGYVDTKTTKVELPAASWAGDAAPYSQTVIVPDLADEKTAHAHPVYTGTLKADLAIKEACSCVSYAKRSGKDVTFYCLEAKPETDISIEVEVGV